MKLRERPGGVTPYERIEEDDPELDIQEQELELDEEEFRLRPKVRGGLTIGQLVALIIIVLIALAAVILIIYFATRTTSVPTGESLTAGLGESCTTKPCTPPLICESSKCVGDQNGPCTGPGTCKSGLTCLNNQCKVGLGGHCNFSVDCGPGLVCSSQQICVPQP